MSPIGWLHTMCALLALTAGALLLLRHKGTPSHRRIGWVYVGSMIALNVTALLIYRLSGSFGPFHLAALLSLATIIVGVLPAVRRRPAGMWVEQHYWWMTYSYVGLLAATAAEVTSRLPGTAFWWTVALSSAAVVAGGSVVIVRRARATLAQFRGRA